MYDMTLKELTETLEYRKKGMAYECGNKQYWITMG